MKTKRTVAVSAMALVAGTMSMSMSVMGAGSASAHNPLVTATCVDNHPRLDVDLEFYQVGPQGQQNTVRVYVDQVYRGDLVFGETFKENFDMGNPNESHTYQVTVRAWDDADGGKGFGGTFQGRLAACIHSPIETTVPETTVPVTSTTVAVATDTPPIPTTTVDPETTVVSGVTTVGGGSLPATGGNAVTTVLIGVGLVGVGAGAVLMARRGNRA